LYKPDVERINYIIFKIFEAYDFKLDSEYIFIFNIDDIDRPDFEFEIKEQDYRSWVGKTSLWGYYVKFLCNPIITKDLDEYKFFGKGAGSVHTYKFPTRWIFEDFEDELATGRILFKL